MLNIITYLSNNITDFLCRKEVIKIQDKSIYKYGCEIMLSTAVSFTVILMTGVIFKKLMFSIIYLFLFATLRTFTGGYHADSYFKCNCVFECLFLSTLIIIKVFIKFFTFSVVVLFLLFSLITIICYAPIENINKPLTIKEKKRHRLTSTILCLIYEIIALVIYPFYFNLSVMATITMFIIALLILYQKIKDDEQNEESINKIG